jgi:hypothetical protein
VKRALLLALLAAWPASGAEPVKAKIALKSQQTLDVEIVSRGADNWVYVHEAGKQMEIGLQPADIDKIIFPVELDGDKLDDLYGRAQYKAVLGLLGEPLRPTLPFCDLPTNVSGLTRVYLKSLCWDGRYQDVLDITKTMARSADPAFRQRAALFRALADAGLNRLTEADAELKQAGAVTAKDEVAPLFWYAQAQLQLARKDWLAAQETTARIVAFCGKDLEWLLPGLYLSARCYANANQSNVVAQIAREMTQMYPNSRWTAQTLQLAGPAGKVDQAQDKGTKP